MTAVDPLLLDGTAGTVGGLVALAVITYAIWDAIEVVPAYERHALVVSGEYRRMLEPGVLLVPPLISKTHPIDVRTQELTLPVDVRTREDEEATVEAFVQFQVVDAETTFRAVDDYRRQLVEQIVTTLREEASGRWQEELLDDVEGMEDTLVQALSDTQDWGLSIKEVRVEVVDPAGRDAVPTESVVG